MISFFWIGFLLPVLSFMIYKIAWFPFNYLICWTFLLISWYVISPKTEVQQFCS